jgi:hypothetical protein
MYFFISPTSLRRKENFIIMKAQKHGARLVAKLVRFSEKRRRTGLMFRDGVPYWHGS